MKVSGKAHITLKLKDFPFPKEDRDAIVAEIGERSPYRILSEYIYRLLEGTPFKDHIEQVSATAEQWADDEGNVISGRATLDPD